MKNTFGSYSFGCRVNQAEKEQIDRFLLANGFSLSQKNPFLYIINTCAVTRKAERGKAAYLSDQAKIPKNQNCYRRLCGDKVEF